MITSRNEIFLQINKKHEKLLEDKNDQSLSDEKLLERAKKLLGEICLAGSFIEEKSHRNLLESYAGYWGLFIYRKTDDYPDTILSEFDKFKKIENKSISIHERPPVVESVNIHGNEEYFYGREQELSKLKKWVLEDKYHLVGIFGRGGIGKTTLAIKLQEQIKEQFDFVVLRSLRTAPYIEDFLRNLIKDLTQSTEQQKLSNWSEFSELDKLSLIEHLIVHFQKHRCLLLLDNFETILQSKQEPSKSRKDITQGYQEKYKDYAQLLREIATINHRSCLLLTSREEPRDFTELEKPEAKLPVISLRLKGLSDEEGIKIFRNKGLLENHTAINTSKKVVNYYEGNPLALELVASEIIDNYQRNIESFFESKSKIVGDIYDLLDRQFNRLSELEQAVMYWLAIEQKSILLKDLQENFIQENLRELMEEAILSLKGRSLILEYGERLRLQPLISEYVVQKLTGYIFEEICTGKINLFSSHALLKTNTEENVRRIQERLIINPIKDKLEEAIERTEIERRLKKILLELHKSELHRTGYGGGNLFNLLNEMGFDLKNYDFSNLVVRHANLQDVKLHNVNFTNTELDKPIFAETFGNVVSITFSPDGKFLAIGDTNNDIHLWDVVDGRKFSTYKGHIGFVSAVVFSYDSQILASAGEDQTVKLWDVGTGECLRTLDRHTDFVRSVAFSSDGRTLASGSDDKTVRLWDVGTGECLKTLDRHTDFVRSVAFSPDGSTLASGSDDQTIRLWDVSMGECLKTLDKHTAKIWSVAFSPDGRTLASGSDDQTVRLWDFHTGKCFNLLKKHSKGVWSVAFSPDGRTLASGSDDQTVRLWDVRTGECLETLQEHSSRVCSVAFSPDGRTLASGSDDQTVRLWNFHTGEYLKKWQGYTEWIWSVAFSPDGRTLASGSDDQTVRLWNVSKSQCFKTLKEHTRVVWSVAFSPNGQILASSSGDRTVKLWDTVTGQIFKNLEGHELSVWSIVFSPDGQILASGSGDKTVRLWDVRQGKCIKKLEGHTDFVRAVAFSPNGRILASGSALYVWLWDIDTYTCIGKLEGHTDFVRAVAFSPNGRILASGGIDQTIRLWNPHTGQKLRTLEGHKNWVWSIAFSSDGKILASGSIDRTVRLWDMDTYECLQILEGHDEGISSVTFSPDDRILASGDRDGIIKLWDMETNKFLKTLKFPKPYEDMNITNVVGLNEEEKATLKALGAVEL